MLPSKLREFSGSPATQFGRLEWAPALSNDVSPHYFVPPTGGTAGNGLPIYNWDQAAAQLTRESNGWGGGIGTPAVVTYAFRSSAPPVMPDGAGGFSQFTSAQITAAEIALGLWSDVANITFERVLGSPGDTAYSNNATILFANYSTGVAGAAAFAYYPGSTAPFSLAGDVWVNVSQADNQINVNTMWGEYGLHTLAHEIGHAIGISHPGNYDGGSPTYPADATYWQDARAYTVMSYFGSSGVSHSLNAFAAGPQLHDIAAAQRLYGANMNTRTGDTIYGFNSNTGSEHFDINTLTEGVVFAVWDAGGVDTFDFSGYSSASEIDLRPESFSGVGPGNGGVGVAVGNVAIARGVIIENAIGGGGNDTIIGNSANNTLDGRGGFDTMTGGAGDDTYIVDNLSDTVVELAAQGADTVRASVHHTLAANVESLVLTGAAAINGAGNGEANIIQGNNATNELRGEGGADQLFGFGGIDILDGGAGADAMFGGEGDDIYIVDHASDQTFEAQASWGTDIVFASVSYYLGVNIDNLTLSGASAINGNGNVLNNQITGNAAANVLFGLAGDDLLNGAGGGDQMYGNEGDDIYMVDDVGDIAFEGNAAWGYDTVNSTVTFTISANIEQLNLTGAAAINGSGNLNANAIFGNGAANTLFGYGGNDYLDGGAGADQMYGGEGDDTYIIDNASDFVFEADSAWGVDLARAAVSFRLGLNIDNLELIEAAGAATGWGNVLDNQIAGNSAANTLFGFAGNDVLNGGAGADQMYGAEGDDTYVVDHVGDVVFEANSGWGTDLVYASVTYTLSANIDWLTLVGFDAVNGSGNAGNNRVVGNDASNTLFGYGGNDILNGAGAADAMYGGEGDDTYFVDNSGDVAFEASAAWGTDTVHAAADFALGSGMDNLILTGSNNLTATGNALDNALTGNSGSNSLNGLGGADILNGGAGNDVLIGGGGDDDFVFAVGDGADVINDFLAGGAEDTIDLSAFNASGVTWEITQVGADTLFNFSNGDSITLLNVDNTQLVQDDPFHYS